jgi:hypothetical protein
MGFFDFLKGEDRTGISQAIQKLLSSVVGALGRFFDSLFQAEIHIEDNARRIGENFNKLRLNIPVQIQRVKDFKFNPHWNTRVINVPIAIEQMRSLIEEVTQGWKERLETFSEPFHEFILIFKAEAMSAGDPQQQVSGVSKAAVKLDEIATLVAQLATASETLVEIDSMFDDVLKFFQDLDQVFLQQGNPRKLVRDAHPRIRVGKLHR